VKGKNIIVVGASESGIALSRHLSEEGHSVTLIELNETLAEQLDEELNVRVIAGDGSSAEKLLEARVGNCHYMIAMTHEDKVNIVACSIAKALGVETTIARIHDQTENDHKIFNYQSHFGIDFLINPEELSAVEIAKNIRNPGRVAVENFARGEIEVQSFKIPEHSSFAQKTLKDIRLPGIRVGYVQKGSHHEVPSRDTVLEVGDIVSLVGSPESLFEIRKKLETSVGPDTVRVVLYGASESAISLIRLLSSPRFRIRVLEENKARCEHLAEQFPQITVINGNAMSLQLLEEEQIDHCDYFVCCSKQDPSNIIACLQAQRVGIKQVMLVINESNYAAILQELKNTIGITAFSSPQSATINEISKIISTEPYTLLGHVPGHVGKIIEVSLPPESRCADKLIREIPWPTGAIIVALLHKYHAKVPGPDDRLLAGDRAVLIVEESKIKTVLELLR